MYKLDYVWLDGYDVKNMRMKTRYFNGYELDMSDLPVWGFDGSSTDQAEGHDSDCVLEPIKMYKNPLDPMGMSHIVLCEVMNPDGTPHASNTRAQLRSIIDNCGGLETVAKDMMFGIEQEYVIFDKKTGRPSGWPSNGFPPPQGRYYCGVGGDVVEHRDLVDDHAEMCNRIGIPVQGTNAEVMLSQWEYQVGPSNVIDVCDHLWTARFILEMLAEKKGLYIKFDPKPVSGDWNGSGAHINFSSKFMREEATMDDIDAICREIGKYGHEMLSVYGKDNDKRLTGNHETAHIEDYTWGVSDRSASVRIPMSTANRGRGHLEDRRPAANIDPYEAVGVITKYLNIIEKEVAQPSLFV
jgi:glutamine synthetase